MLSSNDKGEDELLQQKESIESLISEGNNLIEEDETIMSRMKEPVVVKDKEQLACLNFQEKTVRQTSRVVIEMGNQSSILIKNETKVLQRNWTCNKEEYSNEDEGEADMSHAKEKSVLAH